MTNKLTERPRGLLLRLKKKRSGEVKVKRFTRVGRDLAAYVARELAGSSSSGVVAPQKPSVKLKGSLAQQAVHRLAPQLRDLGLQTVDVRVGPSGGLVLECRIDQEIEDQYLPKRDIGTAFMRAARDAGSWMDDLTFQTADAQ